MDLNDLTLFYDFRAFMNSTLPNSGFVREKVDDLTSQIPHSEIRNLKSNIGIIDKLVKSCQTRGQFKTPYARRDKPGPIPRRMGLSMAGHAKKPGPTLKGWD
jgi:hypothetical protein